LVPTLQGAIASLAEFPKRCPLAPENSAFPFEVRQLLYGKKPHTYRILFTIEGQTVYVLHIRHGRRAALRH
jgi:plasmid stabilization system protein ParE